MRSEWQGRLIKRQLSHVTHVQAMPVSHMSEVWLCAGRLVIIVLLGGGKAQIRLLVTYATAAWCRQSRLHQRALTWTFTRGKCVQVSALWCSLTWTFTRGKCVQTSHCNTSHCLDAGTAKEGGNTQEGGKTKEGGKTQEGGKTMEGGKRMEGGKTSR